MEQGSDYSFPVESALEMVLAFDEKGIIFQANETAKRKLESGDEIYGKHISDVFPNTFQTCEEGFTTEYSFGDEVQNLVAYRKNYTCFPVEARIIASGVEPGKYICMAIDILEKEYLNREVEKVRQEAEEAMKVKSEFVANVTHELRTPVNGILGNVREMLEWDNNDQTTRSLQLIERCCDDMNKIINNILDFSKLEAGKFTLEPRKFDFRNMIDYVKGNHINKITEKGLDFFISVSPQIPEHIIGDELRIVQILNNLLSNAQKFTSVGKITLEVLKTAQVNDKIELFFIVADSGIGIEPSDQDKLFQSFSQVDASISRKYGGTGLGLNICKQLVELMGGRIEVESEKNKGSTFSFSIWVGVCEEENNEMLDDMQMSLLASMPMTGTSTDQLATDTNPDDIKTFGTPENQKSLERTLSKLILCVEMENWEKAEMFMETVRQLTEDAPREIKRVALRLKMAIQKENYDKIIAEFEELNQML